MSFGAGGDTAQFIDFASVSSGASASLQYRPANAANTSGTLTVTDGAHSASVLLVGNYTSNSFVTSAAGDGSPEVFDPPVATVHSANVALLVNYMAATVITPAADFGRQSLLNAEQFQDRQMLLSPKHV
jgi:hypothetical protein